MKAIYFISLMVAAVALLTLNVPVHATTTDSRIESSAKKSYVFKTYLKDDDIKIESMDGAVTLTGIISEEYHKSLAHETVAGLPCVKSVDNRLEIKGSPPTANSDAWLRDKVKATFLFHRNVNETEVFAKGGNRTQNQLRQAGSLPTIPVVRLSTDFSHINTEKSLLI